MKRTDVLEQIASFIGCIDRPHPVRVAIDGVDGAGKTTLADELVEPVQAHGRKVIRASVDGFHNPRRLLYERGRNSPEGYYLDSFDYGSLATTLLEALGPGGLLNYRSAVFDYRRDASVLRPLSRSPADAVLLFDGIFLMRPELVQHWDMVIFVEASFDVTVDRARLRDRAESGTDEGIAARDDRR